MQNEEGNTDETLETAGCQEVQKRQSPAQPQPRPMRETPRLGPTFIGKMRSQSLTVAMLSGMKGKLPGESSSCDMLGLEIPSLRVLS